MKRNWAPGGDNIGTELLKCGGRVLKEQVHKLIIQIWNKNKCLKTGVWDLFFHHLKKGDKIECLNYRGIMLLNVAQKIFLHSTGQKAKPIPWRDSRRIPVWILSGRSSTEQIFILRQSLEKWYEYGIDVKTLFIDYKQAFDNVNKYELQRSLKS